VDTFVSDPTVVEEIWVTTSEAAEITGYNRQYVIRLAWKMAQQPEAERDIKIRRRNGHELWLPDLIAYIEHSRGPYGQRSRH
jgi:hypothetical protein